MSSTTLPNDPRWPRAGHLFSSADESAADLTLIGVPAWRTSISATGAHATPAAVRAALLRYSTYSAEHGVDLATMRLVDAGDIEEPDGPAGEKRVMTRLAHAQPNLGFLIALGGDNSITYSVALGVWGEKISQAGLITLDAHHDLRDGETNGSPVRRLIEAGLAGARVVQIGIADYSNSPEYAARARDLGITVITRASLRTRSMADVISTALAIAGAAGLVVPGIVAEPQGMEPVPFGPQRNLDGGAAVDHPRLRNLHGIPPRTSRARRNTGPAAGSISSP